MHGDNLFFVNDYSVKLHEILCFFFNITSGYTSLRSDHNTQLHRVKSTSPIVWAVHIIMTYYSVIVNHTRCAQSDKVTYLCQGIPGAQDIRLWRYEVSLIIHIWKCSFLEQLLQHNNLCVTFLRLAHGISGCRTAFDSSALSPEFYWQTFMFLCIDNA